jgi:calcium binding protein 39
VQLLGELLLDRANFTVMTKFISNAEHLKLIMNLLRDKSRNIQFEAFHVFKARTHTSHYITSHHITSHHITSHHMVGHAQVFVANPSKTKPILDILLKNKDKVCSARLCIMLSRTHLHHGSCGSWRSS